MNTEHADKQGLLAQFFEYRESFRLTGNPIYLERGASCVKAAKVMGWDDIVFAMVMSTLDSTQALA